MLEPFDTPFNKRAAECVWSERYIQHSAHISLGRDGLFNLVRGLRDTLRYENHAVLAGFQATVLPRHGSPPMSCVFEDGKLAEHWEVLQDEATEAGSLSGLPMVGDRFPD